MINWQYGPAKELNKRFLLSKISCNLKVKQVSVGYGTYLHSYTNFNLWLYSIKALTINFFLILKLDQFHRYPVCTLGQHSQEETLLIILTKLDDFPAMQVIKAFHWPSVVVRYLYVNVQLWNASNFQREIVNCRICKNDSNQFRFSVFLY